MLSPFEGSINTGDPAGIKIHLQENKEINKESDKLDISALNSKDIMDHFLSLANKCGWVRLAFMVQTGAGSKNNFRVV